MSLCDCNKILLGNPSAFYIRNTLDRISRKIWHDYKKAYEIGFSPREETFTENLLIELGRTHPKEVKIIKISSSDEKTYGADWLWCFSDNKNKLLHFSLVQAKKLYVESLRYKKIGYTVSGKSQKEILLNKAKELEIPVCYLLYNFIPTTKRVNISHWGMPKSIMGGTILPENQFNRTVSNDKFYELNKYTTPLRCLLCPNYYSYIQGKKLSYELQKLFGVEYFNVIIEPRSKQNQSFEDELSKFIFEHIKPSQKYDDLFKNISGVVTIKLDSP